METLLLILAVLFWIAAIACGIDAIKLERRISPTWCVLIVWCLLLSGLAFFSVLLMRG